LVKELNKIHHEAIGYRFIISSFELVFRKNIPDFFFLLRYIRGKPKLFLEFVSEINLLKNQLIPNGFGIILKIMLFPLGM
jgi:hypothetical protein